MTLQFNLRWASLFRSFSKGSSIIAFMVSLSVLLSWIFDIAALKSFNIDHATTMKANTAISFIMVSVSLWLLQMKRANPWIGRIAQGCACTVSLIGLLTLIEYSIGWDIGIDQLLFQDHDIASGISPPGRMSPITALNFLLIGIALVFLDTKNQRYYQLVQVLILIIIIISFPILLGYVYSVKPLYRIAFYIGIAAHTAILFFILCIGILSLHPNRGFMAVLTSVSAGGRLARRLLGATVFILPFLAWIRLLGERRELYTTEFGLSIIVILSIAIFALIIWQGAIVLDRSDTDRQRMEGQLHEATQRLKFHIENSPLAVIEWNADYKITRWTGEAEKIFGWSGGEILGKRFDALRWVYEEDWDNVQQAMADMLDGSRASNVNKNRNYRKDGSVIHCEWYNSALFDSSGKLVSVLSLVLDVTKRKRAENELKKHQEHLEELIKVRTAELKTMNEQLHQEINERKQVEESLRISESKYRLLLENLPQRVFYKDKNLMYVSCNENFAKDFHMKPDKIYGKTDYDLFPKGLADKQRIDDKRIMESGQREDRDEVYIRDGKELVLHTIKIPIRDEKGTIIGILGSFLDITEKVILQKEAERFKHLASLGELAAGVGHEINNPATGVINCAQILFNKSQEGSKERDLASRIMKEGDRIAKIVHCLLSFASPGNKENKSVVSVNEIVSDTLVLTGAQLRKEGINLKQYIPPRLSEILANPQLIQQVFLNAINNARYALNQKYPDTHDNKILEISGEEITIDNQSYIKITFHDHGTGIPDHIRVKVMNPFFTTKPTGRGTGLGLSISHSIVKDHGGRLMIESIEGEFTKTSIILPTKIS